MYGTATVERKIQHDIFYARVWLDKIVDEVWVVTAPLEIRVQRVMKRNSITREKVIERINSQIGGYESDELPVRIIGIAKEIRRKV